MNDLTTSDLSTASRLVAGSATLPLETTALRVTARGGIARVVLEQRFANHHPEPLALTYVLPLPADAAVSGYSFCIGDRRIEGEIDRRAAARERYEDAIVRGHTAALLEQERSSLFTQQIGNVPPGARVVCEVAIDQRLRWIEEGSWEWRFPLAAAPRYLGNDGRVADAGALALEVATSLSPRASLALAIGDAIAPGRAPESPSHRVHGIPDGPGHRVAFADGNAAELDRDVVVRWPVAGLVPAVSVLAERTARGAHALVTIVPPAPGTAPPVVRRDLIVLLDTSGSMAGPPIEQSRRVAMALVDGLRDHDTFELIEFASAQRRFAPGALAATPAHRTAALAWLAALRAGGGTEMRDGILEALRPIRGDTQRQVVVITDGLIGFEREIVQAIVERLPPGSRVHTIGVGSSVNRSLTGPAARAGRGAEIILGLGEDPERAVQRLRARTEAPLVVDVSLEGDAVIAVAPSRIPDLFAGCPVLVSAKLRPEGGEVVVRGRGANGSWEQRATVAPIAVGTDPQGVGVVSALFGREAVEDCELRLAAGGDPAEIDRAVEQLGLDHGIATRLTSWIAVDRTPSVDPRSPTRREVVPQVLPHGMSVDGLGLREVDPQRRFGPASSGQAGGSFGGPRGGELGRAREARGGGPRTEDKPVRRPRPDYKGAFTGHSTPVVRATVIHRKGREITIEIGLPFHFRWEPETFDVLLVDGGELTGSVDLSRTTRAGRIAEGQIARITIVLHADSDARVVQIVFARHAFVVV
jgi:Ca-activated chloride channel family protein